MLAEYLRNLEAELDSASAEMHENLSTMHNRMGIFKELMEYQVKEILER